MAWEKAREGFDRFVNGCRSWRASYTSSQWKRTCSRFEIIVKEKKQREQRQWSRRRFRQSQRDSREEPAAFCDWSSAPCAGWRQPCGWSAPKWSGRWVATRPAVPAAYCAAALAGGTRWRWSPSRTSKESGRRVWSTEDPVGCSTEGPTVAVG